MMAFQHNEDAVVAMWAEARRKMEGLEEEMATEFEIKRRERPKNVTKHRTKTTKAKGNVT